MQTCKYREITNINNAEIWCKHPYFSNVAHTYVCVCVCVYLSASTSRTGRPWDQLFTIQAVSKAARKPLAQPVPIGQKGCTETHSKYMNVFVCRCVWGDKKTSRLHNCKAQKSPLQILWLDWKPLFYIYRSSKTRHYKWSNTDRP